MTIVFAACADPVSEKPADVEEWRLEDQPAVTIGAVDGDERYAFGSLGGAMFTDAGHIVIVDRTAKQLVFYDTAGVYLSTGGRSGRGPGEFQLPLVPVPYRGDSIIVFDARLRRVSVFDNEGQHGRDVTLRVAPPRPTRTLRPTQSSYIAYQAFSDGSFVLEYPSMVPTSPGPPRHASSTLVRLSAEGATLDTIGVFASHLYYHYPSRGSDVRTYRLSASHTYQTVGQSLFIGNGEAPAIVRVTGGQRDSIRLDMSQQAVTPELKAAVEQGYRTGYERYPRNFEGPPNALWEGEYMPHAPAYLRVQNDPDGNLWLQQWQLPYSGEPIPYFLFDQSGRHIARISIPHGSVLAAIARNAVLLIERDSLDVQYVRRYNVIR